VTKRFIPRLQPAQQVIVFPRPSPQRLVANLADVPETSLALGALTLPPDVPHRYTLSFIASCQKAVARAARFFKFSSLLSLESGKPSTSLPGQR